MNTALNEKFREVLWLMQKYRLHNYARGRNMADASRGQGRVLAVLKLRDGISTKDLSYLLGVRVSSLNELLSKMEKSGYVVREPSEQDKRVMLVKLTEKGRQEEQPDSPLSETIFSCLSEEEQQTLEGLLDKVITFLRADVWSDDEAFARVKGLRERFGDFPGAPFGFQAHGRGGCGFGRFGRGDFPGYCGGRDGGGPEES